MRAARDALPITAVRHDLVKSLRFGWVVVMSGGTGSSKSTHCPQYILKDAIARGWGAETHIILIKP